MKTFFLKIFLFTFLGLILFLCTVFVRRLILKKQSQSLNIILISIDSLRADHMGVYGYKKNTTPNIDKWAKNAMVFTNAYTVVPQTWPSFVTLLTGQSPLTTRILNNPRSTTQQWDPRVNALPLSNDIKTLPKILKENGYFNAAFVSNPVLNTSSNIDEGFDIYENIPWGENEISEASVNTALNFLDNNNNKKIFYWIHLLDPHYPYAPPEDLKCKFNQKHCNLKETYESLEKERMFYIEQSTKTCGDYQKIPQDKKEILEMLYDGEIAFSDGLVKKILDKLSETGLEKNSIIILYGDHGENFDHNFFFDHGPNVYQSGIKIPLIIKYPLNKTTNARINRLIQNTDIFPTILDLLGITLKDEVDGKNFSDLFYKKIFSTFSFKKREEMYLIDSSISKFSIINNNYKYIYNYRSCAYKDFKEELYNLDNDQEEMTNLVDTKKDIATKLNIKLLNYFSRYNLPQYYDKNPHPYDEVLNPKDIPTPTLTKEMEQLKSLGY